MDTDAVNNVAVSSITSLPSSQASQYQLPANSESFDDSMSFRTVCNKLEDTQPAALLSANILNLGKQKRITYELIETGTKRNKPMLVDSYGFCYSRIIDKHYKGSKMTWKCTVHPSTTPCKAAVVQDGISWIAGIHTHNHPAQPRRDQYIKTVTEVKQQQLS